MLELPKGAGHVFTGFVADDVHTHLADLASKVLHTMCVAFELNPIKDTYVKHLIWSRLFCL